MSDVNLMTLVLRLQDDVGILRERVAILEQRQPNVYHQYQEQKPPTQKRSRSPSPSRSRSRSRSPSPNKRTNPDLCTIFIKNIDLNQISRFDISSMCKEYGEVKHLFIKPTKPDMTYTWGNCRFESKNNRNTILDDSDRIKKEYGLEISAYRPRRKY
jgi:hypothetical protein